MIGTVAQFSEQDLVKRMPVWQAMSELFRDTELDDRDYQMIAATLAASGYTIAELDTIMQQEVAPALQSNLMGSGEWKGWSQDTVKEIVLARLTRQRWYQQIPGLQRTVQRWNMTIIQDAWTAVKSKMKEIAGV